MLAPGQSRSFENASLIKKFRSVEAYLSWLVDDRPADKHAYQLRLVAKGPSSPAGRFLQRNIGAFLDAGLECRVIFTNAAEKRRSRNMLRLYEKSPVENEGSIRIWIARFERVDVIEMLDLGRFTGHGYDCSSELDGVYLTPLKSSDSSSSFARKFAFDALMSVAVEI